MKTVVKAALPISICHYDKERGLEREIPKKAIANFSPKTTFRASMGFKSTASALLLLCSTIAVLRLFQVSIEIGIYCYMVPDLVRFLGLH